MQLIQYIKQGQLNTSFSHEIKPIACQKQNQREKKTQKNKKEYKKEEENIGKMNIKKKRR